MRSASFKHVFEWVTCFSSDLSTQLGFKNTADRQPAHEDHGCYGLVSFGVDQIF